MNTGAFVRISFCVEATEETKVHIEKLSGSKINVGQRAFIDYDLKIDKKSKLHHFVPILVLANSKSKLHEIKLSGSIG